MLNDAIYLNPSFVSFLPSYSVSANYLFYKGPSEGEGPGDPHGHGINVSLQDGRSELFQAGVGFTNYEDRKIFNFGASKSIVQRFGVGLGGKWMLPNQDAPHPLWNSVLSVTGVPIDWIQLAGVVDNLIETEDGLRFGMYREFILGTKFNISNGILLVYFDPHLAPSAPETFGHELGIEFPFSQEFFLRLGNFRNANVPSMNVRGRGYSLGLGWIAPRISFDYSFKRVLEPVLSNEHSLGATVYF